MSHFDDSTLEDNQLNEQHTIYEDDNVCVQVERYLYGSCHLFALELANITGLKVGAFIEDLTETETGEFFLQHAFCYHPTDENKIIDCRGILEKESAFDDYCDSECLCPIEIEDAKSLLEERMKEGAYHDWDAEISLDPQIPMAIENEQQILHKFINEKIKEGVYPTPGKLSPKKQRKRSP